VAVKVVGGPVQRIDHPQITAWSRLGSRGFHRRGLASIAAKPGLIRIVPILGRAFIALSVLFGQDLVVGVPAPNDVESRFLSFQIHFAYEVAPGLLPGPFGTDLPEVTEVDAGGGLCGFQRCRKEWIHVFTPSGKGSGVFERAVT
jgi:hypothetical protein